jgi:A/G-specific adenine glycosylase
MLQQTRLQVVEPAYRRFVRALPTLARLARAGEDEVLALWSGLGYYTRARSLHRAARALTDAGERAFPRQLDAALALPGVGEYTAAAVLSIAYGLPYPAVDGNVVRVLSRLGCLDNPGDARALASDLLDHARPGDWNQALMELGQTLCLPHAPLCAPCPLRVHCRAHARGQVHRFPRRAERRRAERLDLELTLLRDNDGRLLLQRGVFPHLPHLWLPPIRVRAGEPNAAARAPRVSFRHSILHRVFHVEVDLKVVSPAALDRQARRPPDGGEVALFSPRDLTRIGRSALLTKALRLAGD